MKGKLIASIVAVIAVLVAGTAASSAELPSRPLESLEPELCRDIDTLAAKLQKDGVTDSLEKSICGRIEKMSDPKRQLACYRRLSDAVLSVRFEDVAEFPVEEWPLMMDKADIDEERARLKHVHSQVVWIVEDIWSSMRSVRMPHEDSWDLMFRMFKKMEAECRRLNAQNVANFNVVRDSAEWRFDFFVNHNVFPQDVEKRLRKRFEKVVGRPLRTCDEVWSAQERRSEEHKRTRRAEILKGMELMSRLRENYRKKMNLPPEARIPEPGTGSWRRLTGKKPGKVVLPPSET